MIQLTIVLEEYNSKKKEYTGRDVTKKIWWPCVPRVDEYLTISGDGFKVTTIDHWIEGDGKYYPQIRVSVKCDMSDFQTFIDSKSWTNEYL